MQKTNPMCYVSRTAQLVLLLLSVTLFSCSSEGADPYSPSTNQNPPQSNNPPNNPSPGTPSGGETPEPEDLFSEFDEEITNFMSQHGIRGAQVAIVRFEKLVYYRSFGLANEDAAEPVGPDSRFRIASVSKPITVLAISKLVADRKLSMNDKVFGDGGILGTQYGTPPYSAAIERITVNHLVEHTSGFTNDPYDIMFDAIDLSHEDLINRVLDERAYSGSPGSTYYYSNFGYSLLGRVIEEVTDMTYEDYVREEVLEPMGITQMVIGGDTEAERLPNEVKYYSTWFDPYALPVNRMDSHGGWVASAKDLARFATGTDTRSIVPDLLEFGDGQSYLLNGSYGHFGALAGTQSIISVNTTNSFAVVFNSGNANFDAVLRAMNQLVHDEINARTTWPDENLF